LEIKIALAIIIGYLLGSIPFAYIIARLKKGVDIREVGGGNVGALNTYREIGPLYGLGVLASDIIKGALSVWVAAWLGLELEWICVAGFAAVVGHNWPIFIKFRGGMGAATVIGVLAALAPVPLLISTGVVLLLIGITRNVRLSLCALVLVPVFDWVFDNDFTYIACALGLLLFIGLRLLYNLSKELSGTGGKKNLIIDKEYTAWQTKKNSDT
jgi:glycerol-3-phosphate acyltransferase PlsY